MKLALVPILSNVIFPFHLSGTLVEGADPTIARANDKQVAHDRGRREYSTAGVKFPPYVGQLGCLTISAAKSPCRSLERGQEQECCAGNKESATPNMITHLFTPYGFLEKSSVNLVLRSEVCLL